MNLFILNRGSSSIKCYLYTFKHLPQHTLPPLWQAKISWKDSAEQLKLEVKKNANDASHTQILQGMRMKESLKYAMGYLFEKQTAVLKSLSEIDVIGHRIVHGGLDFTRSVRITSQVKKSIRHFSQLAPLHNLAELEQIALISKLLPRKMQCAIFDTAFHHTLSQVATLYPVPYDWYAQGIRRFGFHGISFQYCTRRANELLPHAKKLVICHLGSGASLCAVNEGKSIDTTMGFTPLEGVMMDTRSGSIDPGILLYLLKKHTKPNELNRILYEQSGLLGVSGISSDMRAIVSSHEERAGLAFDLYIHRLCSHIGSMIASLQGIHALIFTAGIGENIPLLRKRVCDNFSFLGLDLDATLNSAEDRGDRLLSTPHSKVPLLLIHTQEAFEIARECWMIKTCKKV